MEEYVKDAQEIVESITWIQESIRQWELILIEIDEHIKKWEVSKEEGEAYKEKFSKQNEDLKTLLKGFQELTGVVQEHAYLDFKLWNDER